METADSWKKRFEDLSGKLRDALSFIAIHTASMRCVRIQELCEAKKTNDVKLWVDALVKGGWIEIKDSFLYCPDQYRELIVRYLVETGQYKKYADKLFQNIGQYFLPYYGTPGKRSYDTPKTVADIIREFRHALITGDTKIFHLIFEYIYTHDRSKNYTLYPGIKDFCTFDETKIYFEEANQEIRSTLCQCFLVRVVSELTGGIRHIGDILLKTASDPNYDQAMQILLLDYAFLAGQLDAPQLDKLPGNMAQALLAAHRAFLSGNYADAVNSYRLAYKKMPKLSVKNSPIPYLSGIFHALAELRVGDRLSVLETAKFPFTPAARRSKVTLPMRLEGCWKMIESIALRLTGQNPKRLTLMELERWGTHPQWLEQLLYGYEAIWFQLDFDSKLSPLLTEHTQYRQVFRWIAAESHDVLQSFGAGKQADADWTTSFRTTTKSVPLSNLLASQNQWEMILESMQSLIQTESEKSGNPVVSKEQKKSRLTWRVSNEYGNTEFLPFEQTWVSKTKNWTAGKPVALSRLFKSQNTLDFLTEQDRAICSSMRVTNRHYGGTIYELNDKIATKFVGHPLLFSAKTPALHVDVSTGHGEIAMQEKDGKLHVTFSPPLRDYSKHIVNYCPPTEMNDGNSDFFVIEETPLRYKVIKLSKQEVQLRKILGEKGQSFPKEAEASLAELLGKLAGTLTVKTDAKIEFVDVPEIPVESKLYLYLTPGGDGIQAEFFVKPLGTEGPAHRPGIGSERVIAEIAGKKFQTVRNLREELKKRKEFVAKIQAFKTAVFLSNDQYLFETPPDALTLLSELKDSETKPATEEPTAGVPKKRERKKAATESTVTPPVSENDIEIYWTQGEKFAVSSTASFGNCNLSFSSLDEWLSVEGTLSAGGESFELQKIIALLDDNTENRFVKLDDKKYIALTNELRKRLGELKRLSQTKGKAVQLHPLAAAGMEDFFDAVPSLQQDPVWNGIKKRITDAKDYKAPFPKGFTGDLRDYQLDGYAWLARCAKWGVGCCLADDMGLGKTVQALALLLLRAEQGPALVVAPTSVCFNWEREAARFAPALNIKRIQSITAGTGLSKEERDKLITSVKKRDILITSYSLLQQEIELFAKKKYATVILDESQAIKNPESQRAKAASLLQSDFRIGMTGTPIENNLIELWSLFRFLNPGLFGSQKSFEDRFAVPIQREQSAGARSTLRRLAHPFILRRTKSQVLEELPERTEITREIELSREEIALYEAARTKALTELQEMKDKNSGQGRLQILAALTRLRQICCNPKMVLPECGIESSKLEVFCAIMQELKENRHKVLVFSQFVKHLDILRSELDKMGISYQYLDGSTPERERQKRVDAFQSGESDAFLISIKAGGSGLNLTAADYVIHTDPWWNPAVEDQATDRAHRIGQTRPVTVYRLITKGTIEEKIVRLHHEKRDLADKLLEGTDQVNKLSADELIDILRG